ncbi:origin recognition complex subunit 6 [Anomaloglossus baeobatrachus]
MEAETLRRLAPRLGISSAGVLGYVQRGCWGSPPPGCWAASDEDDDEIPRKQARTDTADKEKDYEEWKRKILENAAKAAKPK